jgi:general stress protein CsbA
MGPPLRLVRAIAILLAATGAMLVALLFGYVLRLPFLKVTSVARTAWIALALVIVLFAASRPARRAARAWLSDPIAIYSIIVVFAIVMSLGPQVHAKGRLVAEHSLYGLFYNLVPGFDGVRVPARYAMIVALGLAVLAAYGVRAANSFFAALAASAFFVPRHVAMLAAALIVVEAFAVPLTMNADSTEYKQPGLAPLPGSLVPDPDTRATYDFIARLPDTVAIAELPLGEPAFDIRYMFYSTSHWKRLVNGYSGGEPREYEFLNHSLQDALIRSDRAWDALVSARATHAIVHESFYERDRGPRISAWLRAHGAREVVVFGPNHVFSLRD